VVDKEQKNKKLNKEILVTTNFLIKNVEELSTLFLSLIREAHQGL
jgi:hypothetical protein